MCSCLAYLYSVIGHSDFLVLPLLALRFLPPQTRWLQIRLPSTTSQEEPAQRWIDAFRLASLPRHTARQRTIRTRRNGRAYGTTTARQQVCLSSLCSCRKSSFLVRLTKALLNRQPGLRGILNDDVDNASKES